MLDKFKEKLSAEGYLFIPISVKAGKSNTEIIESEDGKIIVKISAIPEKGKANKEIIRLLADEFDVPKKNVIIIKGEKSRNKTVKIIKNKTV